MSRRSDPFGSTMGKYLVRLKYEKLEETTISIADDQENERNTISALGEINLKLIKIRAIANLKPKIVSTIMYLQRVRDAYVEVMHRLAGRVMQLNNGTNAYSFKNVTCSP